MKEILIVMASSLLALTWVRIMPLMWYIKAYLNRESLKPFDCVFCLSGWLTLLLTLINGSHWVVVLYCTSLAPFVGMLVEHLFDLYIKHKMK